MRSGQGVASASGFATVADAARAITALLHALPAPQPATPQSDDLTALLGARDAIDARITAHLAVFDTAGQAATTPALTTRGWLRATHRLTDTDTGREIALARRLHTDPTRPLPRIAAAVHDEHLTMAQAHAVARATRRAPAEIIPALEAAVLTSGTHLAPTSSGRTCTPSSTPSPPRSPPCPTPTRTPPPTAR